MNISISVTNVWYNISTSDSVAFNFEACFEPSHGMALVLKIDNQTLIAKTQDFAEMSELCMSSWLLIIVACHHNVFSPQVKLPQASVLRCGIAVESEPCQSLHISY